MLQVSASALRLSFYVDSALLASSLSVLNSPMCERTGTTPSASCALFSYSALAEETQRVQHSVYQLYSALMLWAKTMAESEEEPFSCWRYILLTCIFPLSLSDNRYAITLDEY